MSVEVVATTILKPTPLPPPSAPVPLTIFDRAAFDLHIPSLFAFLSPTPSNSSLKSALSRVLFHFPHLAGQIIADRHRHPCIALDNSGVRIVEATVSASLPEMLPLESASGKLSELHPAVCGGVKELLQVQLNRYTCGGLVIGLTSHHRVTDGQSMSNFLTAWVQMVRFGVAPNPPPFLDRAAVRVPRNPPRCEFNHREIEFKSHATPTASGELPATVVNLKARFSADFIADLKSQVPGRATTFEILLAHLWRKISSARRLPATQSTSVKVAVNGRSRLKSLPISPEYFGNLVLWAHPSSAAGDLLTPAASGGLAAAVRIIREAVSRIDDGYFRSFIDFGETEGEKEGELVAAVPEPGSGLCPNLEVDSWLRFNFHSLDFGSGGPCGFVPPDLPVEGLVIFVPSMKEAAGVDVYMALAAEHVEAFERICYSLD